MLPENPDKIRSDTSSMKRKFQKGNPLFQGICVQEPFVSIPIDSGVPEAGCGTVGFWMDENPPKKGQIAPKRHMEEFQGSNRNKFW